MPSVVSLLVAWSLSVVQPLTLDSVLARAALASTAFHEAFQQLVADESYVQVLAGSPSSTWRTQALHSELAMVADAEDATWYGFRDTFEVNGKPVPGHVKGLLERVLLGGRASLIEARSIARKSEPYVLAGSGRAVNAPTFALMVLLPANQSRFAFTLRGERRVGEATVAVIGFRERRGPMVFVDIEGRGVPMTGEFWIDPLSGAVYRSRFVVDSTQTDGVADARKTSPPLQRTVGFPRMDVEVSYKLDQALGVTVPVEMNETFSRDRASAGSVAPQDGPNGGTHHTRQRLSCVAKYANYRRIVAE